MSRPGQPSDEDDGPEYGVDADGYPLPVTTLRRHVNVVVAVLAWALLVLFAGTTVNLAASLVIDPGEGDDLTVELQATAFAAGLTAVCAFVVFALYQRRVLRLRTLGLTYRVWGRTRYHVRWDDITSATVTLGDLIISVSGSPAVTVCPADAVGRTPGQLADSLRPYYPPLQG